MPTRVAFTTPASSIVELRASHDPFERGPMPTPPELPPRPLPARRPSEMAAAWLRWFGIGRLVAAAISVAVVAAGAVWLLHAPAPATEAGLPVATPPTPVPVSSVSAATMVVHVAGAVATPGVHTLHAAARVADAVDAAGGAAPDAELDGINLAAVLADGERVYVPFVGEIDPAVGATAGSAPAGPIDLNTATAADLEALPGVGPATASAIVDDRDRNGPFASVDDLDRVPGIGAAKLETLRPLVTV
jgi:competence protein ComEA